MKICNWQGNQYFSTKWTKLSKRFFFLRNQLHMQYSFFLFLFTRRTRYFFCCCQKAISFYSRRMEQVQKMGYVLEDQVNVSTPNRRFGLLLRSSLPSQHRKREKEPYLQQSAHPSPQDHACKNYLLQSSYKISVRKSGGSSNQVVVEPMDGAKGLGSGINFFFQSCSCERFLIDIY